MQFLPVLVRSGKNLRRAGAARWGLLPAHASHDDKALCAKMKNARSETVSEKPSFAELWRKGRRCIVPASGFYEWPEEKVKGHPGYTITLGEAVGFAGLWNKHDDLVTFTILTTMAAHELSPIHSRMPVIFSPDTAREWLKAPSDEASRMMRHENIFDGFSIAETNVRSDQPVLV